MDSDNELNDIMAKGFAAWKKPIEEIKITENELDKINKKAYMEALHGFLKISYQREMVRQFCQDGILPYVPKDLKLKQMLESQADALSTKPPFMMVTVNPRNDVTLSQLKKKIEKFINKKTIMTYLYVYEVRKENEGLHCHIILQYESKPYDFKRSGKNTFKTICDSSNSHCLNFKFITEADLPQKIDYLLGNKKDSKLAGVECSVNYRKINKLPAFVESSPKLLCRATLKLPLIDESEVTTEGHVNNITDTTTTPTPYGVDRFNDN